MPRNHLKFAAYCQCQLSDHTIAISALSPKAT